MSDAPIFPNESEPPLAASLTDEEKLQLVAKVSADAIYDWDIVAGLTRWNHGMRTLFGYAGDTVQTHEWWQERIFPDDKERVVASVRQALKQKVDYWTEEYKFRRVDGTNAHVIDRGYFIYDRDRNPLRMIGAMVDITSRVNLAEAQAQSAIEERQRLARDLHDSVSQTLYSMTLLAEATHRLAKSGQLDQVIAQSKRLGELSQQSLKEMRLLLFELRLPTLESDGLVKAIQKRLEAVEKRAGIETVLSVEGIERLPVLVEEGLFHMAHEALNNSLKHAAASRVNVSIRSTGSAVEMDIRDNGRGFDPATAQDEGGMGLGNLKERAQKLNADLQIVSGLEKGTQIKIVVPIQEI
ncbi:MAG: hypothetical protein C3F07_11140 [Anaerolineales bacterium]|nr:MAG: hypothetical protein C3F07_11140 [Anaerolineales bacterium]